MRWNGLFRSAAVCAAVVGVFWMTGCKTTPTAESSVVDDGAVPIEGSELAFDVAGLSCPLCAHSLNRQFERMPGVTDHAVDLSTGRVNLTLADGPNRATWADIERAVEDAGFTLGSGPLTGEAIPVRRTDVAMADAIRGYGATVYVDGLSDSYSADAIAAQLKTIDGVTEVTRDLDAGWLHLAFETSGCVGESRVRAAIELFDYEVTRIVPDEGGPTEGGA